jgi:hypothetical protein
MTCVGCRNRPCRGMSKRICVWQKEHCQGTDVACRRCRWPDHFIPGNLEIRTGNAAMSHRCAPAPARILCNGGTHGLTIVHEFAIASKDPSAQSTTGTSVYCGSESRYHQRTVRVPMAFSVPLTDW